MGASLSLSLALALAACSEGCSRELPVTEPEFAQQRMTVDELEALLVPSGSGPWNELSEPQLFALERVVATLIEAAEHERLRGGQARRVAMLAAMAGLQLHDIELEHDATVERVWVLVEPLEDRRGRGSYVIRLGALAKPVPAVELLLQAPHTRFDKFTGTIALRLFAEHGQAMHVRALFVNSVHRYALADGTHHKYEDVSLNRADAAHNEDHPLARATARALAERPLAIVQLHGFDRNPEAGDPDIIVSAGSTRPHAWCTQVTARLRATLSEFSTALFGVDSDRLGALTNVQGRAARTSGRCFVHIEASERVRLKLRDDAAVRRRFADAVFGADAAGSSSACR
jgi:hypothetical protein